MSRNASWVLALVIVLSILPYVSALGFGFVYDDRPQIENNPYLRLWPGYARVFSSDVWSMTDVESDANYYRPLMWVAYNAIYSIAGAAPWAFHLVNLLLHAGVTAVVFFLTLELWKDLRIAGIAAAMFALHPVHTEPVVWIAAVPDLAYSLFFLLALYCYVLDQKPELHAVIASAVCYAVSLFWKESAVMFLPCILLYDVLVLRQFRVRRYAVLGGVTLAYILVRTAVLGGLAPSVVHEGLSTTTQFLTAVSHLGTYVQKLLMPVNLTFFYGLHATSKVDIRIGATILIFALAVWKLRGKLAWSVLWIPVTLLPALAISRVIVPLAERNLYLASVGFVWIAAAILTRLDRMKGLILASVLCLGYFAVGWLHVPVWSNELSLFGQALRLDPENSDIRLQLSKEFTRRGRFDEAITHLNQIPKGGPSGLKALTSKAGLFVMKADWTGVEKTCQDVFAIDGASAVCHLDMGIAALQQGKKEEAWRRFDVAQQSNPRLWQALLEQGLMSLDAGDAPTAIGKFQKVVQISPTAQVFTVLGAAYAQVGESSKAISAFQSALRLDPGFVPAQQALGKAAVQ